MDEPIYTVAEAVNNLQRKLEDIPTLAERYKDKRFDEYYTLLIDETTDDILDVPVNRLCVGLNAIEDDADNMFEQIGEVAGIIAAIFDKNEEEVAFDIVESIKRDAGADMRMAKMHRHAGRLH